MHLADGRLGRQDPPTSRSASRSPSSRARRSSGWSRFKKERGWTRPAVYSDTSGDYTRDYVSAEDADVPGYNVFTRRDGTIRHFWSGEMGRRPPIPARTRAARRT